MPHLTNNNGDKLCVCTADMACDCNAIKTHLENWVYKEARKMSEAVRHEQILKGAEKYEKPLGDADWTPEQLVHHAMQENIDQQHYLTMLLHTIKELREENTRLKHLLTPNE